ncbi:hypothetical protein DPEC_G00303300 [Dallia pectoralis]|uniref:Uncharacterized protein n=1 Tax=Dallia pectoralis TaxID=75939 RepID=A0ACC2FD08_DALPE|nr:hypothetical protein DPEC_G00303300 [Dallia pectoralis]
MPPFKKAPQPSEEVYRRAEQHPVPKLHSLQPSPPPPDTPRSYEEQRPPSSPLTSGQTTSSPGHYTAASHMAPGQSHSKTPIQFSTTAEPCVCQR